MARQQSNTDLAGSLAATLTPALPRSREISFRGGQNSGLFDVGALYAEALDEVLRRTRSDVRLAPLTRAAQPTWPRSPTGPRRPTRGGWGEPVVSFDLDADVPVELGNAVEARPSRGIGWFGVAVAWLATVTMGASIATTLPGHALTRLHLPVSVLPTPPAPPAPPVAASPWSPSVAPSPMAAMTGVSVSSPSPTVVPLTLVVSAPAMAAPPVAAPHLATKHLAHPAAPAPVAHARSPLPASSPVASTVATPPPATGAAHPAAPTAPSRATSSPPAVSTAGMSLDELIRHEVQAESAKHH
jgi:hypothetical protein